MNILGIDTSCDDTSAGVIADGSKVLSNIIHSQVKRHAPHGGVVPELASREHLRNIMPVVEEAVSEARMTLTDLDGIAVTIGPGLIGSLLVGLYYAKALAYTQQIPLVAVNHLEGHLLSIFLEQHNLGFPFLAMTVSGGHTILYHVEGYGKYTVMGQTLDDAAGEAFDKVAKILGLGYPGGIVIDNLSKEGRKDKINFPRAYLSKESFDFSFSGLKTSVSLYIEKWKKMRQDGNQIVIADIAASFQEAVVDVLVEKAMRARKKLGVSTIVVAGGVACNRRLRQRMEKAVDCEGARVFFPSPKYCTDNGAMIALAGYHRFIHQDHADMAVDARSKYPLQDLQPITPAP